MSRKSVTTLIIFLMITVSTPLFAQDTEPQETKPPEKQEKTFHLLRDSSSAADELDFEDEEAEVWEPRIEKGTIEVSFGFGFTDFNKVLWEHDQIIYKYTKDATFWGDVAIKGESAFNPVLRLGYNLTNWFALEGIGGVAITEYSSTITNRRTRENKPNAVIFDDPPLGEFDAEARSLLTLQASLNAVIYPLEIGGDGSGQLFPFLTAGAGRMWYDMNSNYFDGAAGAFDFNFGGGLRVLADKNISLRFEVLAHLNSVEFTPSEYFTTRDEGTIVVPLNEYPRNEDGSVREQVVGSYGSQTLSLLNWSLGVQGSF
ncbi:MAG: hypothetical protein ABFS42_11515 [Candidatus Krumholzibacteriota bacterium]